MEFQKYTPNKYNHFNSKAFNPNLSVIDVIANIGFLKLNNYFLIIMEYI